MKVLFFSPYSYVWQWVFPEALIAKSLQDAGHEVIYIGCDGVFADGVCIPMRVAAADFDSDDSRKEHICNNCIKNKNTIIDAFDFKWGSLSDYLEPKDFDDINTKIETITLDNFFSYTFDGIPLGRIAVYETLMQFKKNSFNFTDEEFCRYKAWLKNAMLVAVASKKVLSKHSPDRLIIYNNLYSANHSFHSVAKKMGVASYCMHAWDNFGSIFQAVFLIRGNAYNYMYDTVRLWRSSYKNQPVNNRTISYIKEHHMSVMSASTIFTYSNPKASEHIDIQKYFGIPAKSRIVVATMSSYDEIYAAYAVGEFDSYEPKIYKSQVLWLTNLIEFFSKREDLFLIIRVHPREFPNRREGRKSENAAVYEELLADLPSNIRVNMPSDNLSIYDLALYADVVLNGCSSVGLEMALLGLPVLSYANEWNSYPVELDYQTENKEEYLAAIDTLLASGWSAERIKMACRWLAFKFGYTAFHIGDAFGYKHGEKVNQKNDLEMMPKSITSAGKIVDFVYSKEQIFVDIDTIKSEQGELFEHEEDLIIRDYIQEVYDFLFKKTASDLEIPALGIKMKTYLEGYRSPVI